jgi:hypothetical protein
VPQPANSFARLHRPALHTFRRAFARAIARAGNRFLEALFVVSHELRPIERDRTLVELRITLFGSSYFSLLSESHIHKRHEFFYKKLARLYIGLWSNTEAVWNDG